MATRGTLSLQNVSRSAQSPETAVPRPKISVTRKSFHPRYQFKIFKSKGAIIVLFWCFCIVFVFNFLSQDHPKLLVRYTKVTGSIVVNMGVFLYPVFGWLADVKFGRYETIKWSLRLMWLVSILFCLASIIESSITIQLQHSMKKKLYTAMRWVLYICSALCLGGVYTNMPQFGIDQLIDASSNEITSFIRWFCWVWFLAELLVGLSQTCICHQYELVALLLLPACLSFSLCIDVFNRLLVKLPTSKNSLTLIFRVLKYAIKNKYPRLRSAFAYWDSQHCSRLDLGKSKYGGPFSTEEVENVKTFWRIFGVIIIATFSVGLYINSSSIRSKMIFHFRSENFVPEDKSKDCDHVFMRSCFQRLAVDASGAGFLVVFFPLYEFVLHPIFKRYVTISILKKFFIGIVFILCGLLGYMTLEFIGHHQIGHNNTIDCLLSVKHYYDDNVLPLRYEWTAIPNVLTYIGDFILLASGGEFLCAHSPYSMKGLLFGIMFGAIGFFTILLYGLLSLVYLLIKRFPPSHYGCGIWYMLSILVLYLLSLFSFYAIYKWYMKKLKKQNLQNEQLIGSEHALIGQ